MTSPITAAFLLLPFYVAAFEVDPRLGAADSLFQAEKYAAAESLYNDVLKTAEGIDKGVGLKGLANIAFYFGNTVIAEKYYNDALKIFKQARYINGEAMIYLNLGIMVLYAGDYLQAEKLLTNALATNRKIKERTREEVENEINILEMLGQVFMVQDELGKAMENLRVAVEKANSAGYNKGVIGGCYLLGGFFQQAAQVDSALLYFNRSCSLSLACRYYKSAFDASREAGNIQRKVGNYDLAYEDLFRALNLADTLKSGKAIMLGEGELLYDIGLLSFDMGKAGEALHYFTRALEVFGKMKNTGWKIEALQSIGHAYLLMAPVNKSNFDSSLYYYKQAKAMITDKKDEAQYYNNLGIVYDNMNNQKAAEENYNLALKGYRACKDSIGIARVLCNLGNLALANGREEQAMEDYRTALEAIKVLKRKDWEASLLSNLGFAQHAAGKTDDAMASLNNAVEIIEELRGKITSQEFRSTYMENKIAVYEKLVGLYCQEGMAQEAFNCAERAKARAFLDLLSGVNFAEKKDLDPVLRSLVEREQEAEKKVEFLTGDPRQSSAIIEHNGILRELAMQFPDYATLKSAKPISIKDLQGLLDQGTAVIEYFIGTRKGYIFVVTDRTLSIKALEVTPVQVYEKVDYYRKVIKRKVNYTDNELVNLSAWFYTSLLEPAASEIKGKKRLCIIPYGVLHDLPFSAIVMDREPLKLLIDEYDIYYAPSASVYQIAHGKNKAVKEHAVIFAKSTFREHADWFDLPLPGTIKETDSILAAKALPRVEVFSDADSSAPQPSETNAKEHLKDFDIIHFATHGKLAGGDSALDSRVILSADESNDGNLRVREIFNMNIDAYLVCLSACETGQLKGFTGGSYTIGDELTGLSRAFIYAGTPSVVASLWKVSDVSTALLISRFYKNLRNMDKAKALCDAQRWLMKKEFYDRPFFWAPFVVIGDWR